jgi:dihydrofolate synthase / folylpolyglutamate synthase
VEAKTIVSLANDLPFYSAQEIGSTFPFSRHRPGSAYHFLLEDLYPRLGAGIIPGQGPLRAVLESLGSPQLHLGECVVVGGTNGKGSVSSMLSHILSKRGYRCGLFTSPHLLQFTERIRVDGEPAQPGILCRLHQKIREAEQKAPRPLTYFEAVTAMAMMYFKEHHVDAAIIEVGLGGKLDATQVVPRRLSVLTPIGLDHQSRLGSTLTLIAREKVEIIEPDGEVVTGPQQDEVEAVIKSYVSQHKVKRFASSQPTLDMASGATPPWSAPYQMQNNAIVQSTLQRLEKLGFGSCRDAWQDATQHFQWAGRYHWLGNDFLLDGAHNQPGIEALIQGIEHDPTIGDRRCHCVFAALRDKNSAAMVALLRPCITRFHPAVLQIERSCCADDLARLCPDALPHQNVTDALTAAWVDAKKDGGFVLVTGSLFLIAETFSILGDHYLDPPVAF